MQFCTGVLAVCNRGFRRGCRGDGILPGHSGGMDEQEQPGMGAFQRGMGGLRLPL